MASPDDLKFQGRGLCVFLVLTLSFCFNLHSARLQSLRKPQISCLQILEPQPSASPAPAQQPPLEMSELICQTMKTISKRVQMWAAKPNRQMRLQKADYFTWYKQFSLNFPTVAWRWKTNWWFLDVWVLSVILQHRYNAGTFVFLLKVVFITPILCYNLGAITMCGIRYRPNSPAWTDKNVCCQLSVNF